MLIVQADLIAHTIKGERQRLRSFGSVKVIDQFYSCFFAPFEEAITGNDLRFCHTPFGVPSSIGGSEKAVGRRTIPATRGRHWLQRAGLPVG